MLKDRFLLVLLVLAAIYIIQTLLLPLDSQAAARYKLSSSELSLLRLTIMIPVLLIWTVAYVGYVRLKDYVATVGDGYEDQGFKKLLIGLLTLALWLPFSSVLGNVVSYIQAQNPDYLPSVVMISNYINLVIIIVAFTYLYLGAKVLRENTKLIKEWRGRPYAYALYGILALGFTYLTLINPSRQFPAEGVPRAAYYLPDWLIVLTIIIPFLTAVFLGLKAVVYLHAYRKSVKGILYVSGLKHLANGIGVVVVSVVFVRALASLTSFFNESDLKSLLGVIYLLILFIGIGYGLIAFGTRKLKRIEEV